MCTTPSVYNRTTPVSRVPRVCCECGWAINPGEKYERVWGVWEGDPGTYITCIPCVGVRDEMVAQLDDYCWCHTSLYEETDEDRNNSAAVQLFKARCHYKSNLKVRDRWLHLAEKTTYPVASSHYANKAEESLREWIRCRKLLIDNGIKVPV